ncbi:fructose-1,6-bisphosphatase [Pseudoflavonifractor capillosus]|uniref:Fructose-1,6-bisphosphatase class 3 n=1 Tax=Pseudoflavonifractor capillosus TaxID=106588 RepID=A0A921MMN1_9FIRM|nr:fructose-1,6-bisphosphatase [Pseudoflavonifractor capillosus]HJG87388.1 fructose-1,6-bisphosphatase [Pseudoflavonifractor capillosus]
MKKEAAASAPSLRYLQMLSRQYPTVQAASSEIINLQAILNLPKGTEHFISDVHGEYEAFLHIMNSASGVVREKVDELFSSSVSKAERDQLATLIYYPEEKLAQVARETRDMEEWYRITLHRLIDICRMVTSKYTRSKVRKAMPKEYAYIIDELINTNYEYHNKRSNYENIISTIIDIDRAEDFIVAVCELIKRMVVDHLHIVGDMFDRGPRADIIMDYLTEYHSVDIQWGNHDVLWMGAATGSRTLVATVLSNSIHYNNLEVIETGYGISLRPLALFANEFYKDVDCSCFKAKFAGDDANNYTEKDKALAARMHKAITIILFKLEGQKILRHPEFGMEDRLLLDKIDYEKKSIVIDGVEYQLSDTDFPTVDRSNPYELSPEEDEVINQLTNSFQRSEKLQRHVRFLYSKGGLYKIYNGNLLLHGCIPLTPEGELLTFRADGKILSGRAFLDYAEAVARQGYYAKPGSEERQYGMDYLWFLWCGRGSPVFGRDRMTTFERRLIKDESSWAEPKNAYYTFYNDPAVCERLLREFGLEGPHCHIINGHVPVKSRKGESPIKGGGKLIVIDGGFCRAYQPTTGIAGYTLIYNSESMRIVSHEPFEGRENAIRENRDILSSSVVFERMDDKVKIRSTDIGSELQRQVDDLKALLAAYRSGLVKEDHRK